MLWISRVYVTLNSLQDLQLWEPEVCMISSTEEWLPQRSFHWSLMNGIPSAWTLPKILDRIEYYSQTINQQVFEQWWSRGHITSLTQAPNTLQEKKLVTQKLATYLQKTRSMLSWFQTQWCWVDQIPIVLGKKNLDNFPGKILSKNHWNRPSRHPHTFLCSPAVIDLSRSTMHRLFSAPIFRVSLFISLGCIKQIWDLLFAKTTW